MAGKLRIVPGADTSGTSPEDADQQLLNARDVATLLRLAPKKVYELPIPRVELSERRVRWLPSDVYAYIRRQRRVA